MALKKKNTKKVEANKKEPKQQLVISTGSTLLDLTISGLRFPEGGIPAGKVVELFGPSAGGKTAISCELSASCQANGGNVRFRDPEGRVDKKYAEIYGMDWSNIDYDMPDTVESVFESLGDVPSSDGVIHLDIVDSAAALSTEQEMEKGDTMGMRRAKVFSEKFRKFCRKVAQQNRIVVFTNQLRQGQGQFGPKEVTPGGNALPYYASLRIRIGETGKFKRKVKVGGKEHERVYGVNSHVYIKKSSIDSPYRECDVPIIFNYGVDDVRGNIEWLRANTTLLGDAKGMYTLDGKKYYLKAFIEKLEREDRVEEIRQLVIENWKAIENAVKEERVPKVRR